MAAMPDEKTLPSFDASDPAQVQAKVKQAKRKQKAEEDVMRVLLSSMAGRGWLWSLMSFCNAFSQSYISGDPHGTTFNEGKRAVGNKLLMEAMGADSALFLKMLKDNGGKVSG